MPNNVVRSVGMLVLCAALAASTRSTASVGSRDWRPVIDTLPSPAAGDSGQPQLTVSARGVLLSWIEREGARATLKLAERMPNGWTTPRTVASGNDWFVNWADVPSVLRLDDGTLAAHWLQKSATGTYAYDVRLAYSTDDGRTWSAPFSPHHDGAKVEHGFASLFQMPGAGLAVVWLDGRAMASTDGHGEHGASGGAMSLRFAAFDAKWTQTADAAIDNRVCECCPTAVAVTREGPIVAFRNRSDEEVRDIHVARLEGGVWSEPTAVHDDGWRIPACPVNGPSLSASGRDVAIAWFTASGDVGHAFAAFSADAGRTFGPPIQLDAASALGRVDVELLPDGSAVATWIEFSREGSQFSARRVRPSGERSAPVTVSRIEGTRASGYPRMALAGDELVFAWTVVRDGRAQVSAARARLEGADGRSLGASD